MKKVLIISYYFPPLNSMAAKRYGTMCKYFKACGYEAYILTTTINECDYLGAKRDLEVPIPLENIIRIGKEKQIKGIQEKVIHWFNGILYKRKFCSRAIMGYDELLWYEKVRKKIDWEKFKDIDIIIGTYGPIGNLYIAKYLSDKLKCFYVADIRDLISEWQEAEDGYRRCYKIDQMIEKMLLSSANGIVTTTHGFKKILQNKYNSKRVITIYNGWDKTQIGQRGHSEEKYLYYAGSLYEHRLDGFGLLLNALKKINEKENIKLIVRSIGPKKLDDKARKMVAKMGMTSYITILPSAPFEVINEEQREAYIHIILSSVQEENIDQMVTVPGKTYELMNEKAPVLAITSKKSDLAKILAYTNKGIATTSEDEIIQFILHDHNQYIGNNHIRKFSREYQAKRLCGFMDEIVKGK